MSERARTINEDLDTIVANDLDKKINNQGMGAWAAQKDEWAAINELSAPKKIEITSAFSQEELIDARTELSHIENIGLLSDTKLISYLDRYTAGEKMPPITSASEKNRSSSPEETAAALSEFKLASEDALLVDDPSEPEQKIRLRDRVAALSTNAAFRVGRFAKRNWEKMPPKMRRTAMLGAGATIAAGLVTSRFGLHVGPLSPEIANATTTAPSSNLLDQSQFNLPKVPGIPTIDTPTTTGVPINPDASPTTVNLGSETKDQFKQAVHENHTGNKMISKGVTSELDDAKHGKLKGENLETFREDMQRKTGRRGEYLANLRFKMLEGNEAATYAGGIDKISIMTDHYLDAQGTHLSESGERAYKHFSNFVEHAKVEKVSAQEAMNRGFNVNAGIVEGDLKRGLDDKTVVGGSVDKDVYILTGKNGQGKTIQLAVKEDCYNLLSKQPYVVAEAAPATPVTYQPAPETGIVTGGNPSGGYTDRLEGGGNNGGDAGEITNEGGPRRDQDPSPTPEGTTDPTPETDTPDNGNSKKPADDINANSALPEQVKVDPGIPAGERKEATPPPAEYTAPPPPAPAPEVRTEPVPTPEAPAPTPTAPATGDPGAP